MLPKSLVAGLRVLPAAVIWLYACGETSTQQPGADSAGFAGAGSPGYARGGAAGSSGGSSGITSTCFEAGSLVATPNGSVPIEALVVGDWVLAFDEQVGAVAARRVTKTFVHQVEASGRLPLSDGRVLRVTGEHPIYDAARSAYVRADSLDGDETLVTLTGSAVGATPPLALARTAAPGFSSAAREESVTVFNISVEGLENYFVDGVLVHNKSGGSCGGDCGECRPIPEPWILGECANQAPCIDPTNPEPGSVALNEPASSGDPGAVGGAGGESNAAGAGGIGGNGSAGAGGTGAESGADAGGASSADAGGAGGAAAQATGAYAMTVPVCQSVLQSLLLAVDYRMPLVEDGTAGFSVYMGEACGGSQLGEVWLDDHEPPALGSITTQCVSVWAEGPNLSLHSLHPEGEIVGVRFVSECECVRRFRYTTTCGIEGFSDCN